MRRSNRFILLIAAIFIAAFSAGCKPESLVSTQAEVDVGRQAAEQVERQYKVSTDPALNQLVTNMGQTLATQAAPRTGIQYKFKVLESKEVNAFALPGGWVYVFTGMVDAIGNDHDMLAAVMGHEIGHVAARHHAQIMGRSTLYGIGIAVLTKGSTTNWANFFANLNLLRWSRKDEYIADQLAVEYLYKGRQYDPNGVIRLLEMLKKQGGNSKFASFLRTHPLTQDRIDRAKYWVQQYQQTGGPGK